MNRTIVLVTGCPGCGKTSFAARILKRYPTFVLSSYDKTKEEYFDRFGFDTLQERAELNKRSWLAYYSELDQLMQSGSPILTDYPFNNLVHEKDLNDIIAKNGYKALSITLDGDAETLRQRGYRRDMNDENRNFGHLLTRYHKGNFSESDRIPTMTLEEFIQTNQKKDYNLRVGKNIRIDVTDLDNIDYETAFSEIEKLF